MLKTEVAELLRKNYGKKNPPVLTAGETVRVHQKIREGEKERIQVFEGLVIAVKHGNGLDGSFTVRKISAGGIGVERTYPVHSPNVIKVERVRKADVSRAKLYYMRDRMGKNARFKKEVSSKESWSEAAAVAAAEEVVIPEEAPASTPEAEEVATETVEETAPETVAEVEETEETTTEVADAEEVAGDQDESKADA